MIIKKSTYCPGVQSIKIEIPQDLKGVRLITYSWPTLLSRGTSKLFPYIFKRTFCDNCPLYGLYYNYSDDLLIRCTKGSCSLFYVELRKDNQYYQKIERIELSCENGQQIYLVPGVAWGILTQIDEIELQIQSSEDPNKQPILVLDPLDPQINLVDLLCAEEFKVEKYSTQPASIEMFEEIVQDHFVQESQENKSGDTDAINKKELEIPGACILLYQKGVCELKYKKVYCYFDFVYVGIKKWFLQHFEMYFSFKNTIRGFYIQDAPWCNTQLFQCISGCCKVFLLDLRDAKPTYLQCTSVELDCHEHSFLYFEEGIAYAVLSLADNTKLYCLSDNTVSNVVQTTVSIFDERFQKELPSEGLIASAKDRAAPKATDLLHNYW